MGGLPIAPNIIVSGTQQDVYLFSQRLVWNRLNAGDAGLYATISRTGEDLCADLMAKGWDVSPFIRTGVLKILDYLSLADGRPGTPEEKLRALFSIGMEALTPERFNQIFIRESYGLRERAPGQRLFVIFDSVDRLIEAMGFENTLRLAQTVSQGLKGTNSMTVGLLCNEFLSRETIEDVREAASVFIELKREWKGKDIQRMVRVTKAQGKKSSANWVPWYY